MSAKARQMYPVVYPEDCDPESFKAGTSWLKRFKDRHGIRGLSVQGEFMSAATDTVDDFKRKLSELVEEKGSIAMRLGCTGS